MSKQRPRTNDLDQHMTEPGVLQIAIALIEGFAIAGSLLGWLYFSAIDRSVRISEFPNREMHRLDKIVNR